MSTYVPVPVVLGSITLPADGENIDAMDVNSPLQAIADGVKFLQARTDVLADLTALAAIAAPANGLVRHVATHGLYVFQTSGTTGLSPFRVAATDATPGGWVASSAHEVTLTRWVAASYITGVSGTASAGATAEAPSTDPLGFVSTAASASFRAGHMKVGLASVHASNAFGFCLPLDAFLVDGATLSSVSLLYKPTAHGVSPTQFPRLGVIRSPKAGPYTVIPTTLLSTGGGLVQDSGGTYVSDRTLVFTPNQNNVIDRAAYTYTALIWDEHGTNAVNGNGYSGLSLAMTNILDGRR